MLLGAAAVGVMGCAGPAQTPTRTTVQQASGAAARAQASPTAAPRSAPRPAPLVHLVYVKLKDPAQTAALVADSDAMLGTIPSVTSYFCGTHRDTGRSTVDGDYDVAMGIGFADLAGYQAYLDAPAHVSFVETWKPRCQWIRIHDVEDDTP